jgi:hypothetical protein
MPVIPTPVITATPPAAYNNRPIAAAPTVPVPVPISITVGVIAVVRVRTVVAGRRSAAIVNIARVPVALYIAITRRDITTGKCAREYDQSEGCKQVFDG